VCLYYFIISYSQKQHIDLKNINHNIHTIQNQSIQHQIQPNHNNFLANPVIQSLLIATSQLTQYVQIAGKYVIKAIGYG
jgi:hypothetical protein